MTPAAVHVRVGGKAGFRRENMGRQVFEAFVQTVEAGLGAEEREPRGPDVGGNHVGAGNVQHHGEQVLHVQTEDGSAVGFQVAHGFQFFAEPVGGFEVRHVDEAVYLAHRAVLLVDRTDFRFQHEERLSGLHARQMRNFTCDVAAGERMLQTQESAFFIGRERVAQLLPPYGMREVARGQYVYALDSGPCRKVRNGETGTCGAGETGMDMQVGSEHGRLATKKVERRCRQSDS